MPLTLAWCLPFVSQGSLLCITLVIYIYTIYSIPCVNLSASEAWLTPDYTSLEALVRLMNGSVSFDIYSRSLNVKLQLYQF